MMEDAKKLSKKEEKKDVAKEESLVLSTKRSIHPPIEVTVDRKVYQNRPLSRALFEKLKEYEQAALDGDIEALYTQVTTLFGVPIETLNELDVRDIRSLLEYTMAKIFPPEEGGPKTEAEKTEKKE